MVYILFVCWSLMSMMNRWISRNKTNWGLVIIILFSVNDLWWGWFNNKKSSKRLKNNEPFWDFYVVNLFTFLINRVDLKLSLFCCGFQDLWWCDYECKAHTAWCFIKQLKRLWDQYFIIMPQYRWLDDGEVLVRIVLVSLIFNCCIDSWKLQNQVSLKKNWAAYGLDKSTMKEVIAMFS